MAKKKEETRELFTPKVMTVIITLLLAFPIGFVVGAMSAEEANEAADSHDHSTATSTHVHDKVHNVPNAANAPTVDMAVVQDSKAGWNVFLTVDNFKFAPENVNQDHVEGEGHAHLWVDGEKITRLYSPYYYLGELAEGDHEIMVTLNTNDHADYAIDGAVISDMMMVTDMHHSDEGHFEGDGHDHSGDSHSKEEGHSDDDGHSHN